MKKIVFIVLIICMLLTFSACMGDMSIYTKNEQDEYMNDALYRSDQKMTRTMHLCDITFNDWFGNEKIILNFAEGKSDKEQIPTYVIQYDEKALTFDITIENVNCDDFQIPAQKEMKNIASIDYNTTGENDFVVSMQLKNKILYRIDETKEYSMIVICLIKK